MIEGNVVEGGVVEGTPATPPAAAPADAAPPAAAPADVTPQTGAQIVPANSALLTLHVPADAEVLVNGRKTTSTGTVRRYMSKGLQDGYQYTYKVEATVTRDGQTITDTKVVRLRPGTQAAVAMAGNNKQESVATTLTLEVPENAQVRLAGVETKSAGKVRVFATNRLAAGQKWEDYKVEVTVDQDGQSITKHETLTLNAGETRTVSFDFAQPVKLADNR